MRIIVVTGTNTGSGKTVVTGLLARLFHAAGQNVAALKPICSGSRDDARMLRASCGGRLKLEQVNPWHFRASVAPLLAARQEKRAVTLHDVVAHVREIFHSHSTVVIEGAGGLLSPLGEHFCTRELIAALGAEVVVAARNELGVVNHVRLTLEALPPLVRGRARIALISTGRPNAVARTNRALLGEFIPAEHIAALPWLTHPHDHDRALGLPAVRAALQLLAQ